MRHGAATAALALVAGAAALAGPAWTNYGGDPQHTARSRVAAQPLETVRWSAPVDLDPQFAGSGALLAHYGSPLFTKRNTVVFPVKTGAFEGFRVDAKDAASGGPLWTLDTDYVMPPHRWTPPCGICLTPNGTVVVPAAGGTLLFRRRADRPEGEPARFAFYGNAAYAAQRETFDANLWICTPVTCDTDGDLYFGFRATINAPLGLVSGFVRISAAGRVTTTTSALASGDPLGSQAGMNAAPALSRDGRTLYVVVRDDEGFGWLCALDAKSLKRRASVRLFDPELTSSPAVISDDATSSPTVGPDGDVYIGVLEARGSTHGFHGWLLHFDGRLREEKLPGPFGWDDTASIVPSEAVPSYTGPSRYLVLTKHNDYVVTGGTGVNRLSVLDPSVAAVDDGVEVMATVLTIAGPTPDPENRDDAHPDAVCEWCINTAAVDAKGRCALVNSEDGTLYRWDFVTNTLAESIVLTTGIGEAYTPTVIGPDGSVYAINAARLYAVGRLGD